MNWNTALEANPELAELLKPFLDAVNDELHHLKRVIYDLHTRERYSEARRSAMSDEELERRNRLLARLLGLDMEELREPAEP